VAGDEQQDPVAEGFGHRRLCGTRQGSSCSRRNAP
jgi:hypothetical protein